MNEARMLKKSIPALKKLLWVDFSLASKLSRSTDGTNVDCFTCGRGMRIGDSGCQGGHWLVKSGYPCHYFHPDNVRPQCYHCNINLSGNSAVFERNLIEEIGKERVDWLYENRMMKIKRTRGWYVDAIKHYRKQIEEISVARADGITSVFFLEHFE